jgi:glutamate/tyrosine decarboxylase-like PLP-dependent enzyme
MQLRHLGRDGYRRLIAADLATARELRLAIEASSDFELLASGLSVVCFRHRPWTGLVWTGLVWTGTIGPYCSPSSWAAARSWPVPP